MSSQPVQALPGSSTQSTIDLLFREYERARSEKLRAEAELASFADSISRLIERLPDLVRQDVQVQFDALRGTTATSGSTGSRGSEVFDNVVKLFERFPGRQWSVPNIQGALEQNGISPDPKAVYNVLTYLARAGRLLRVARGQYVALGAGITLVEGPEDGIARASEHDF